MQGLIRSGVACLQVVNVLLKASNQTDEHFKLRRGNPGQDLTAGFGNHCFHFSDNGSRFLSEFNSLGATVAGTGLSGDQPLLFQLVKRTHQLRLLNTNRLCQLNL